MKGFLISCEDCSGTGIREVNIENPYGGRSDVETECGGCDGTGKVPMASVILSAIVMVSVNKGQKGDNEWFEVTLEARTDDGWDIVSSESRQNAMPGPEWMEQEVAEWLSR